MRPPSERATPGCCSYCRCTLSRRRWVCRCPEVTRRARGYGWDPREALCWRSTDMAVDSIATLPDKTPGASAEMPSSGATSADRMRLLSLSFLVLFVELALIRWTAANNVHLASLTNFVLFASFLGLGIGFLRADSRFRLLPLAPVALALLVVFVLAFPVSINALSRRRLLHGASGLPVLPLWRIVPVIFVLVAATLAAIGQEA